MIQITKQGTIPPSLMTGACDACGCEIECDKRDTREGKLGQDMTTCHFIECPSCGGLFYVKEKESTPPSSA